MKHHLEDFAFCSWVILFNLNPWHSFLCMGVSSVNKEDKTLRIWKA